MLNLSDVRDSLPPSTLPIVFIVLVVVGNLSFAATTILPHWLTYQQLTDELATNRDALAEREAEQANADLSTVLRAQVNAAEDKRNAMALMLLTPAEGDQFIERLYDHASAHHIDITNLQARQTMQMAETGIYELQTYRVQAEGTSEDLLYSLAAMKDLMVPGVTLDEVSLAQNPGGVLLLTISVYTSPYGAGELADVLPRLTGESVLAVPMPEPPVEILATTAPVLAAAAMAVPVDCPGAQPSPFQAGDTVVVDFEGVGALRILEKASGLDTLTQVYDGSQLQLLDGPLCGTWHGEKILYWHVDYHGLEGWAGEGDSQDRWMCPVTNPDCS